MIAAFAWRVVAILAALTLSVPAAAIVCGEPVPTGGYPWLIGISEPGGTVHCSATLIRADVLLTAEHCFVGGSGQFLAQSPGGVSIPFVRGNILEIRPGLDASIVRLPAAFMVNEDGLPSYQHSQADIPGDAVAAGWSRAKEPPRRPVTSDCPKTMADGLPRHGTVSFLPTDVCIVRGKKSSEPEPQILCAHGQTVLSKKDQSSFVFDSPGIGTCAGDSGGPLLDIRGRRPVLIGIQNSVRNLSRHVAATWLSCARNPSLFLATAPIAHEIKAAIERADNGRPTPETLKRNPDFQ